MSSQGTRIYVLDKFWVWWQISSFGETLAFPSSIYIHGFDNYIDNNLELVISKFWAMHDTRLPSKLWSIGRDTHTNFDEIKCFVSISQKKVLQQKKCTTFCVLLGPWHFEVGHIVTSLCALHSCTWYTNANLSEWSHRSPKTKPIERHTKYGTSQSTPTNPDPSSNHCILNHFSDTKGKTTFLCLLSCFHDAIHPTYRPGWSIDPLESLGPLQDLDHDDKLS